LIHSQVITLKIEVSARFVGKLLNRSVSISVQGGTFHSKKSIENTWQIWLKPQILALNTAVFPEC